MNAKEHYQAGQLKEAVAAATEEVKKRPTDAGCRGFLAELLCFAGDFDRADKQLDALSHQDPDTNLGVLQLRHLVRAAIARQQFFNEGRLPEFLDQPSDELRLRLEASVLIREGSLPQAFDLLERAEELRKPLTGTCDGKPFEDIRDQDDLTASFLEVLTSNGKYYWIPFERIDEIEFHAPERPHDLLWRRVHMVVRGGPDGEVFLPVLYPGTHTNADDRLRLGRATDWTGGNGAPARGIGQRMFWIGNGEKSIMELQNLSIQSL